MTEERALLNSFSEQRLFITFQDLKGKEFFADASKGDNTCKEI